VAGRAGPLATFVDGFLLNPTLFAAVAVGVGLVVAGGSLYKIRALAGG
jgi:hypothetical protein